MSLLTDVQSAVTSAFAAVSSLLQNVTYEQNATEYLEYNVELGVRPAAVTTTALLALVESFKVEELANNPVLEPGDLKITFPQSYLSSTPTLKDWLIYNGERFTVVYVAAGDPANTLWVITARR